MRWSLIIKEFGELVHAPWFHNLFKQVAFSGEWVWLEEYLSTNEHEWLFREVKATAVQEALNEALLTSGVNEVECFTREPSRFVNERDVAQYLLMTASVLEYYTRQQKTIFVAAYYLIYIAVFFQFKDRYPVVSYEDTWDMISNDFGARGLGDHVLSNTSSTILA